MARARELFPGGVSSPVRAFHGVGGEPFVVERGEGARIWDVDGNEYIDYVLSWGPLVLGHAAPAVLQALRDTMTRGTSFGIPTSLEIDLAELVQQRMPHVEMMRFVSSGTEATMSALRLARAATGRDMVLKFDGCYHGHADSFLVRAGSGVATLGLPNSPGVPDALAALTLTAPFNDVHSAEQLMLTHGDRVAAIIVEPVVGNAGFISPDPAFLPALRRLATLHGAILIFDEVMTGFRVALGGATELFAVTPDLVTLGKVIGGGLPVAAYGGRRDLMERVAPAGPVYQAGTLSGNPLAMAAGIATLAALTPAVQERIARQTRALIEGLRGIAARRSVPFTADSAGSMFGFFFRAEPVRS
ncbi:MAG: glutamate-1-semialdehyde 2,1-aminomutase, partial [Gemmatimonadaceae bacterium]